jgi:hypothetical protein
VVKAARKPVSVSSSVAEPVAASCGSITIVCVPVASSVGLSVFPVVPKRVGATRFVPFGRRIDTLALQQVELPIETLVIVSVISWLEVPEKERVPFWPEVERVIVSGPPSIVIEPLESAGTS